MEGREVNGFRLKKEQRKEIKFAIKRGEDLEKMKSKYLLMKSIITQGHKQYIKS